MSSPDSVRSVPILPMNSIMSRIHSFDLTSIIVAWSPSIMIMYFIVITPSNGRPERTLTTGSELSRPSRHPRPRIRERGSRPEAERSAGQERVSRVTRSLGLVQGRAL